MKALYILPATAPVAALKVEPFDSVGRFLVQSGSRPEVHFVVDVLYNRCTCEDATMRHRCCKHLCAAREYLLEDVLNVLRRQQPDTEALIA